MAALSDETGTLKFVHTYGAGLHSGDTDPKVHDPRWQQRQVEDFVEFAVVAEELGCDGITVTEVSGTPDQVIAALQQVIDETGARRLLVETFSREEARLLAREVIPVLREQNAAGAAAEAGQAGARS